MAYRVTMVKIRRSEGENINEELQWLGNSLGLFGLRDRDSSCFRVFITLVREARKNETLSSDDIANRLHLSRGTVVHHLSKLMDAGIVVHEKEGYLLRENRLQKVVEDLRNDLENMFADLQEVAKEIDEKLG